MTRPSSPAPPEPQRRAGSEPLVDAIGDYMTHRQSGEIGSDAGGASPRALRRARRATRTLAAVAAALVIALVIVLIVL